MFIPLIINENVYECLANLSVHKYEYFNFLSGLLKCSSLYHWGTIGSSIHATLNIV